MLPLDLLTGQPPHLYLKLSSSAAASRCTSPRPCQHTSWAEHLELEMPTEDQDQMWNAFQDAWGGTGLAIAAPDAILEVALVSLGCDDRSVSGATPSKTAKAAEPTLHPVVKALVCASFR